MNTYRIFAALVLILCAFSPASAQLLSLDDNPSMPVATPPSPGFGTAECEWINTGIPGSPTLGALVAADADTLVPGPAIFAPVAPFSYVDAMSSNHVWQPMTGTPLTFSVDRRSLDLAGIPIPPDDVNIAGVASLDPMGLAGALAGAPAPWSTIVFTPPAPAPFGPYASGAGMGLVPGDNIDGWDRYLPAPPANPDLYLAVSAAETALTGAPAEGILFAVPGYNTVAMWAPPGAMGLGAMGGPDSIDALVVFDNGAIGGLDTSLDCALFSLDPCSPTLAALNAMGVGVDGATIFYTDFNGNFAIYTWGMNLGITPNGGNVDALGRP